MTTFARFAFVNLCFLAAFASSDAQAAAATQFSVSVPGSATTGTAFNITVTALDSTNTTDTTYAGVVHFTSTDGTAVLPSDATLTNGVGTFSATFNSAGLQTITASNITVTVTGGAGSFTLTFNGQTTSAIAFNASAAQVQASLNALSSIGGAGGSASVTGAASNYTIVFGGTLSGPQPMSGTGSGGATAVVDSISGASNTVEVTASTPVKLQEFGVN